MKEKILNSFISTNLRKLGLVHVNSEVPKLMSVNRRNRTDIMAYDIESKMPIIIELKAKKDPGVLVQLQEYVAEIPKEYPHVFEELNVFRYDQKIEFNYEYGIIGIVISPEPPPIDVANSEHTLLWVQYVIQDRKFKVIGKSILNKSKECEKYFKSRPTFNPLKPEDFVKSNLYNLKEYVRRLHNTYLSISTTIYPRYKIGNNYIAYWPTDGTRAVYGFNTGSSNSYVDVEFHIYGKNHSRFLEHDETQKLKTIDLILRKPKKGQIYPIRIDEEFASDNNFVLKSLQLFRSMAELSYNFEIKSEIDDHKIDIDSINALSISSFGL